MLDSGVTRLWGEVPVLFILEEGAMLQKLYPGCQRREQERGGVHTGRLGQEDCKCEPSLGNLVSLCLKMQDEKEERKEGRRKERKEREREKLRV